MSRYEYPRDREAIARWIKSKGFPSASAYAKACGIARQNLRGFMSGIFNPDIHTLIKFATVAKCSVDEVTSLFYTEEMQEHNKAVKTSGLLTINSDINRLEDKLERMENAINALTKAKDI